MQERQTHALGVYSSKNKMLPFPMMEVAGYNMLPTGRWLVIPGSGVIYGTWSWFLLLSVWVLSNYYGQVCGRSCVLAEATAKPMHDLPLCNDSGFTGFNRVATWGGGWYHKKGHPTLVIAGLLC